MQIIFEKGNVIPFDQLPNNSIALDGYVQGPQVDPENRRYSFDHHAGCLRLVTKATCEQVLESILLGLTTDENTKIYINDIDGDTALSVWLLLNQQWAWEPATQDLVRKIGLTDAHGPAFKPHSMHSELTPPPPWVKDSPPQSLDMLEGMLEKLNLWHQGKFSPSPKSEELSKGWAWSAQKGWFAVEVKGGMEGFYAAGAVLGFLYQKLPDGTFMYTVAKASDLVPAKLGPGSKVRPVTDIAQFENTILGHLGGIEQMKNPSQSLAHTWGGGTSIGGSPRNPDGSSSRLTPDEVLEIFQQFQA